MAHQSDREPQAATFRLEAGAQADGLLAKPLRAVLRLIHRHPRTGSFGEAGDLFFHLAEAHRPRDKFASDDIASFRRRGRAFGVLPVMRVTASTYAAQET